MAHFKAFKSAVSAALCLLGIGGAQAALFDRGGGLIYDSDFNITWLADANYARTSGYHADGLMNWGAATAWAAGLVYGGYSDWRLPTALNEDLSWPCNGYNCIGSEMGHLFYTELGGTAASPIPASPHFQNVQFFVYWSGTAYAPNPADGSAWNFITYSGYQYINLQYAEYYAWAVRDGDVAAPIPEPETYAMLLAGLGLLGFHARRRKQKEAALA